MATAQLPRSSSHCVQSEDDDEPDDGASGDHDDNDDPIEKPIIVPLQ